MKSVLMIKKANCMEVTRYGPPNFYRWKSRSQRHYIHKRFPGATGVCNGVPASMGGRFIFL